MYGTAERMEPLPSKHESGVTHRAPPEAYTPILPSCTMRAWIIESDPSSLLPRRRGIPPRFRPPVLHDRRFFLIIRGWKQ